MTRFSRQLVPERASCSLSTGGRESVKKQKQKKLQDDRRLRHSDGGTFWRLSPTLPDAPLQLREDVGQQDLAERLVELGEDVADGVQRVVACRRHPLSFLRAYEGKKKNLIRF